MVEIGRHFTTDGRDRRTVDRWRMEERAAEIHCRLVVEGECGGTPEARDVEEELLDELVQLEADLRTEELDVRGSGRTWDIAEKGRIL